jgi:SsrA-binding protein
MHDSSVIVLNKKARFDFFIEEEFEAGISLLGWEIKSLRQKKVNLSDAYVLMKQGEAYLLGARIEPLPTVSTHVFADPIRTRKLLMHRKELSRLIGSVERAGFTLIPLALYWKNNRVKLRLALAKGKKTHDKRETIKSRDWDRQKARILKQS